MRDITLLITVLLLNTIGHLATDIYLPSMPSMADYFGTSPTLVQLTFSVYMLSFCIVPLFSGPISDTIGRKKPLYFGLFISLLATFLCSFSPNIYLLIFSRFLQGIGLGIVVSVSRTILPDNFQGQKLARYLSYMTMFFPLILAIGPTLGGVIQDHSSWQMVFIFMLVYLLFLLLFVKYVFVDHKKPTLSKKIDIKEYLQSYKNLFKNHTFMLYTGCSVLIFMGISAYLTLCSFLFQTTLGLTPTESGALSLVVSSVVFIIGFINTRLIQRVKPKKLLYFANSFIIISGISLLLLSQFQFITLKVVLLPILFFFAAVPITFANATALGLSSIRENFGAAMALSGCLQFLGGTLSSLASSFSKFDITSTLGCAFFMVGLGYFFVLYLESIRKQKLITEKA